MSGTVRHDSTLSTLSPVQAQVVAALAGGQSISAAARSAGVHRSTIHLWTKSQPDFAGALRDAQRERAEAFRDEIAELQALAFRTLRSLLDDPNTPPAVRLKAALAILDRPQPAGAAWALPEPQESPPGAEITRQQRGVEPECPPPSQPPAPRALVPRNAPCPCGSRLKYKRCCGRAAPPVLARAA